MTTTTKAALADELGISRARVSQYVKDGLPVRSDGKLDRDKALNWLNRHGRGLNTGADRGVNRASRLAKPKPAAKAHRPEPAPEEPTDLVRDLIVAMIQRTEAVTAFAAIAAGATAETAFAAAGIARMEMMEAGADIALALGVPDGDDGPLGVVGATPYPPDWAALADIAGEPVALDEWRAAENALPYWTETDLPEPPHPWASGPGPSEAPL